MSTYKNLMTVCCAAVLALGLAACGSSGDGDDQADMTPPEMCPEGQVGTPPNCMTPEPPGPTEAELAQIQARAERSAKAIGPGSTRADAFAAANSDNDETAPFQINAMNNLAAQNADGSADDAMANSFGDPTSEFTRRAAGMTWSGSRYDRGDRTMDGETVIGIIRFHDRAANTAAEYQDHYQSSNAGNLDGIASITDNDTGNVISFDADVSDVSAHLSVPMFPTGDRQMFTFEPAEEDDPITAFDETSAVRLSGSFHGVPGRYSCATGCSATTNMDGEVVTLGGTWTFTPTAQQAGDDPYMVAGVVPDADYLNFGYWWMYTVGEADTLRYAAFHEGSLADYDVTAVEGKAEYEGLAAGTFMRKTLTPDGMPTQPFMSGGFSADVALTAYFGGNAVSANDADSISGTVSNFRRSGSDALGNRVSGDPIDPNWTVELNKIGGATGGTGTYTVGTGTFTGGTTTGGGSWEGRFQGQDDTTTTDVTEQPTGVTGTFDAHFTNGHVLGAFGARKK